MLGLAQLVDAIRRIAGVGDSAFDADGLMATALRRAGRPMFRDRSFEAPLRVLLDCYAREANLNLFGRLASKWDVLRCLGNLVRFEEEEETHPEILAEPIGRPIFITGLPRSGTSFLHTLLSQDPAILMPRCWQTIAPYPQRGKRRDTRRKQVDRQLAFFQRLAPEMASLHPLEANSPQECTEITSQVFQSLRYEATHRIPSYQSWLDSRGHLPAYRFHKRYLQHLQHQHGAAQWILKCPDHVHALNAIETVYPDCQFVFVHRDPLRVIASAAKLTEVVRRPFTRAVDKIEIGRQVVVRTQESAEAMMGRCRPTQRDRVFHIHYTQLATEPMTAIKGLYDRFGIALSSEAATRMGCYLRQARQHLTHRYSFEEFGLDPTALSIQFASYMNRFDVLRESAAWKTLDPVQAAKAA